MMMRWPCMVQINQIHVLKLLQDLTELVKGVDFKVFSEAPAVKAIVVKGAADHYSRKDIDKLTEVAKQYGAKGLAWV